ncbi:hypothetical protein CW745_06115 [Psychromonas sp. psych-6C06]|uniref:DUF3299 domain-containing protein n=1 Tax=Psychromonas sp. psych-6C06 TaxID=2058089 RepID=UPI000C33AEF8|nr:DUF3299 domain-containing protein [Psychromonas sp. psych-6C06]PKF62998.1 hypothetical protein CW745_06115 [Psychromonas sp. psych-6C06]
MKPLFLLCLSLCFASTLQAAEPIKISWQDLRGKIAPYEDPFIDLSNDQLYHLSISARITELQKKAPEKVTPEMLDAAESAKAALIAEKLDIDYLLAQRLILMEKRQQAAVATNPTLADKQIEMPGYMLAIEFDGELVSEFLLVPVVGACSHKPVPPANQIVFVKTKTPVKAGSPYMPIVVTGQLRLKPQAKDLYLVDGSKRIEMAYSIEDATIEPF